MGSVMKAFFPDQPICRIVAAAAVMSVAALGMLRVVESDDAAFRSQNSGTPAPLSMPVASGESH
jgi:hypothetical protein